MSPARPPTLEIGHLSLRIPGQTSEDGRSIAQRVARRLEQALSTEEGRSLTGSTGPTGPVNLTLRLRQDATTSPDALTGTIARGVIGALTRPEEK